MNYVKRNIDETNESYNRRVWFVSQIKPKTKKDYDEAIKLSNIWVNAILLGCIYPIMVMNKIKILLNKSNFTNKNT
jgi:hypothetical protein